MNDKKQGMNPSYVRRKGFENLMKRMLLKA